MTTLTPELQKAILDAGDQPVAVLDPQTHERYVLLAEAYERLQLLLEHNPLSQEEQRAFSAWPASTLGGMTPRWTSTTTLIRAMKRGDVIIVDFPFSDAAGSKVRPALIVQADELNRRLDDTILALITSSRSRFTGSATQLPINVSTPDGRESGLRLPSVVQCENLVTVDKSFVIHTIGRLSGTLMQQIDQCLKAALDIRH